MTRHIGGALALFALVSAAPSQEVSGPPNFAVGIQTLHESLQLASVTLRLHQFLNTVTDDQRRTQLAGLVTHWYQGGVPLQELSQWNASFDQASQAVLARLEAAAAASPDRDRAIRTLEKARVQLNFQRTINGTLTDPLARALGILDLGQSTARYGSWFETVDEELEARLLAEASKPVHTPLPPDDPLTLLPQAAGLNLGKTSLWDTDLQRETAVDEIRIFVRAELASRVPVFQVYVAAEGAAWTQVYAHNGSSFGADGRPLVIHLNNARARRVGVTWTYAGFNPFANLEVYATGSPRVFAPSPVTPPVPLQPPVSQPPVSPPPTGSIPGGVPGLATSTINLALGRPTSTSSRSTYSTPAESGAVDGVKNGLFGFHTNNEANPWWEVDLQQTAALGEIRVFNYRENSVVADRARTLRALVSLDGVNWRLVHDQNGRTFGMDSQPLRITLNVVSARWIRLQLNERNWLHLDEVEVYATGTATSAAHGGSIGPRPPDAIYIPPPTDASGIFLGTDTTTLGNWRTRYGRDGAMIAADAGAVPFRSATVTPRGKNDYAWGETTEARGLVRVNGSDRWAGCWYADPVFDVEIVPTGGPARLSAYFMDFDSIGRSERVELIDPATNAVLDTRTLTNFAGGLYLSWQIASPVTLRIRNLKPGANAVLNGLFLDYGSGRASSTSTASSAVFVGNDATTQGIWVGRHGKDAAVVIGDGASRSADPVTPRGHTDYSWGATEEARASVHHHPRFSAPRRSRAATTRADRTAPEY